MPWAGVTVTSLARVWIVSADPPAETAAWCRGVLDDGEREWAAALGNQRARQEYEVAHGALRILTARELGVHPATLHWTRGRHGRPELKPPCDGLSTSLSHSEGLIVVAVAVGRAVGVDIQRFVPSPAAAALSARYYPHAEAEYITAAADLETRADLFTRLWSRKEAVVKAAGGRLWPHLQMAVQHSDVVCCAEPAGAIYRVADIAAPAGFRASVALAGAAPFAIEACAWPGEGERTRLR